MHKEIKEHASKNRLVENGGKDNEWENQKPNEFEGETSGLSIAQNCIN